MRHILSAIIVATALLELSNTADAASSSWRCEFPGYKEPSTYIAELGTGKGIAVGNLGVSDVRVVEGTVAISFLEPLFTGAVQVTTIVLKTGEAALSHNTVYVLGDHEDFQPSQVRGKCRPLP
jgi:hypothetical protein